MGLGSTPCGSPSVLTRDWISENSRRCAIWRDEKGFRLPLII